MNQNLFFNLLSFNWPAENVTIYFSRRQFRRSFRVHKTIFPINLSSIYPEVHEKGFEFVYTSFDKPVNGIESIAISFCEDNWAFLKHYFLHKASNYFYDVHGLVVALNFVDHLNVYVPGKQNDSLPYDNYYKFSIIFQYAQVTSGPEMIIAYDNTTFVLKQSVNELASQCSPNLSTTVFYDYSFVKYKELLKKGNITFYKAYPVLNRDLSNALGIDRIPYKKGTRYETNLSMLKGFIDRFILIKDFESLFPGASEGFISVDPELCGNVDPSCNLLKFGESKGDSPKRNMLRLKPYYNRVKSSIHFIFIYHSQDKHLRDLLAKYFGQEGLGFYRGFTAYTGIPIYIDQSKDIIFTDKQNPLPEVKRALVLNGYEDSIKYMAIYLTPFSLSESRKQPVRYYARIKEALLTKNIQCQAVKPESIQNLGDAFKYSLTTMSVAMIAKLGCIPWLLNTDPSKELVVGIGISRHNQVEYISSAFAFENNGKFRQFEYFTKNSTKLLAGNIAEAVQDFVDKYGVVERLIIHFYKKISQEEIEPIEIALSNLKLGYDIPIFIVYIVRTDSGSLFAFDQSFKFLMPYSGTYMHIGKHQYLLFNNSRQPNDTSGFDPRDGFPFPIKMALYCNKMDELEKPENVNMLITQVYQFSRMYWRSLFQQGMPVTIRYPELVADVAPHFENPGIPDNAKDSLWFL